MTRSTAIIAAIMLIASSAQAQTTTCTPFGISVQCETSPSGAETFARGMATLGNAIRARQDRQKAAIAFRQALASGDCSRAAAIAQAYGDANDVRHVANNCVSAEAQAAKEAARAKEAEKIWMDNVAQLTLAGRCEEAKAAALDGGRLDVADQVVRVCTPGVRAAVEVPKTPPR